MKRLPLQLILPTYPLRATFYQFILNLLVRSSRIPNFMADYIKFHL